MPKYRMCDLNSCDVKLNPFVENKGTNTSCMLNFMFYFVFINRTF